MGYTPEEKSQSDTASLKESVNNLKEAIKKIIDSDDDSLKRYYDIIDKELENAATSREQYNSVVKDVLEMYRNQLEKENLTEDERKLILEKVEEVFKAVGEKDSEIREHEKILEKKANEKDSEKRRFGESVLKYVGFAALMVAAFSIGAISGDTNIKLPGKKEDEIEELNSTDDTIDTIQ